MNSIRRFSQTLPNLKPKPPIKHHVFFDTESNWDQRKGLMDKTVHTLRFGVAKHCVWNGSDLKIIDEKVFKNVEGFWCWLLKQRYEGQCWVWAHNLAFDGTMVNLWEMLQAKNANLIHFTDCDLPCFFQAQVYETPFLFVDSLNIFKTSLSKLGKEMGLPKIDMPIQSAPYCEWEVYCSNDVDILVKAVSAWIGLIQDHGLGRMSPTLAGQALTAYRTKFMYHPIHLHCHKVATRIERESYYGGIVEPGFIGKVPFSPICEYDVNSLYPYVMTKHKYPNLLVGVHDNPNPRKMRELMTRYYCIAYCRVKSTTYSYPVRHKGRLYFALGDFWTCLHMPELQQAYDMNQLAEIACVAYYHTSNLFTDYVEYFYDLRMKYVKGGQDGFAYICKLFLNALYGKFGQKRPRWEPYTEAMLSRLEVETGLMPGELSLLKDHIESGDRDVLRFRHPYNQVAYAARHLLGHGQISCGDGESPWSFPAIAGAVTANARSYVRNIQAIIGRRQYVYTDTDSFFVSVNGARKLSRDGLIDTTALGRLKPKTRSKTMVIHGPKDYETDIEVKRKGIREKADPDGDNTWVQDQWPSFKGLAREGFPHEITIKRTRKTLHRQVTTVHQGEDGWTRPVLLCLNNRKTI